MTLMASPGLVSVSPIMIGGRPSAVSKLGYPIDYAYKRLPSESVASESGQACQCQWQVSGMPVRRIILVFHDVGGLPTAVAGSFLSLLQKALFSDRTTQTALDLPCG